MTTEPTTPQPVDPAARDRRRRRVVAPVGRITVAGLSASATFGLVAVMGASAADPSGTGIPADPAVGTPSGAPTGAGTEAPPTTRRRVYVIDHLPADAPLPDGSAPGSDPDAAAEPLPDGAPAAATGTPTAAGLARSRTRRS